MGGSKSGRRSATLRTFEDCWDVHDLRGTLDGVDSVDVWTMWTQEVQADGGEWLRSMLAERGEVYPARRCFLERSTRQTVTSTFQPTRLRTPRFSSMKAKPKCLQLAKELSCWQRAGQIRQKWRIQTPNSTGRNRSESHGLANRISMIIFY